MYNYCYDRFGNLYATTVSGAGRGLSVVDLDTNNIVGFHVGVPRMKCC